MSLKKTCKVVNRVAPHEAETNSIMGICSEKMDDINIYEQAQKKTTPPRKLIRRHSFTTFLNKNLFRELALRVIDPNSPTTPLYERPQSRIFLDIQ